MLRNQFAAQICYEIGEERQRLIATPDFRRGSYRITPCMLLKDLILPKSALLSIWPVFSVVIRVGALSDGGLARAYLKSVRRFLPGAVKLRSSSSGGRK